MLARQTLKELSMSLLGSFGSPRKETVPVESASSKSSLEALQPLRDADRDMVDTWRDTRLSEWLSE